MAYLTDALRVARLIGAEYTLFSVGHGGSAGDDVRWDRMLRSLRRLSAAAEQEELQAALDAQKLVCAELTDAISGEDQEEYIAQIARDSLGYIYPGEQVYVDIFSK